MNTLEDSFLNIGKEEHKYGVQIENCPAPDCLEKSYNYFDKLFFIFFY